MEYDYTLEKNVFYLTLIVSCYFLFAFTGVLQNTDFELITKLFKLLTIPFILLVLNILAISLFKLLANPLKLTFYTLANFFISAGIILVMVFVLT